MSRGCVRGSVLPGPALHCVRPTAPSGRVPREGGGGAGRDLPGAVRGAARGAARPPFRAVLRPERVPAGSGRPHPAARGSGLVGSRGGAFLRGEGSGDTVPAPGLAVPLRG